MKKTVSKARMKKYIQAFRKIDEGVFDAANFLKESGDDYFSYQEVFEAYDKLLMALHMEPDCSPVWQFLSQFKDDHDVEDMDEDGIFK